MKTSESFLSHLMQEALLEAQKASQQGEVPVGAVIAYQGKIVARAHNEVEGQTDATSHAEVLAIRRAADSLENWRLNECVLCVTLEPCTMCLGAIKLARISTLVFGAFDERMGACSSLYDLAQDSRSGPVPRVISGLEEEKCRELLQSFFQSKRKANK